MQANWTNGPEVRKERTTEAGLERYQTVPHSKRRTRPSLVAHAVARLYRIDHVDNETGQFVSNHFVGLAVGVSAGGRKFFGEPIPYDAAYGGTHCRHCAFNCQGYTLQGHKFR